MDMVTLCVAVLASPSEEGRRTRLLVPKGPVAAKLTEIAQLPCTVHTQQKIGVLYAMKQCDTNVLSPAQDDNHLLFGNVRHA